MSTRLYCKSGFCAREDGYELGEEARRVFPPDQSLICHTCVATQRTIAVENALRWEAQRAERERRTTEEHASREAADKAKLDARIASAMAAAGEPNDVYARASEWNGGSAQHLAGPFYICPRCKAVKEDPSDFDLIYRSGKRPQFNGETLCDSCFRDANWISA